MTTYLGYASGTLPPRLSPAEVRRELRRHQVSQSDVFTSADQGDKLAAKVYAALIAGKDVPTRTLAVWLGY